MDFNDSPTPETPEGSQVCLHDWTELLFSDEETLACERCGEQWELESGTAVGVVWQSGRNAISLMAAKLDGIEEILAEHLGLEACVGCGEFVDLDSEDVLELSEGPRCGACVVHALEDADEDDLEQVWEWALEHGLPGARHVSLRARWERLVLVAPVLALQCGEDSLAVPTDTVMLPPDTATALGVSPFVGLDALTRRVAELLEIDAPHTRAGAAYLLGMFELSARLAPVAYDSSLRDQLASAVREQVQLPDTSRAAVIHDLLAGSGADASTNGLGRELLEMLTERGAAVLLDKLRERVGDDADDVSGVDDEESDEDQLSDQHGAAGTSGGASSAK